jgi:Fe-S cluster assembly protein SufD
MDLKEKLLASYAVFENNLDVEDPILDLRNDSIKVFEDKGFPTKKEEAWKYTSLGKIQLTDYSLFPKEEDCVNYQEVKKYFLHEIETYKLVFIDGVYSSFLSETTHVGIDVCLMSVALKKPHYKELIDTYFNKVASKEESLTTLNTSFSKEGAFIYIPKNTVADKTIEIINFSSGTDAALMIQPRNMIIADQGAEVQLIERHQSLSENQTLTNVVSEIYAAQNAKIDLYKIQNDRLSASLIDNTYIDQKRDSVVSVHTFSFGGKLTRNNLNFYQNGENINSILKGVTIIGDKQHVDHHTLVHHKEPNCESHQDYKGIYDDACTAVFNGKIIVDKIAQKTNAFQQNNNILMEDKATINSKPQLEIFADDVKCSHGCTIGQLDEDALFYLQTRGIPKKEARALLMYAFANNVLESVALPVIKKRINKIIAKKLGVELGFSL